MKTGQKWKLINRKDATVAKEIDASDLWEQVGQGPQGDNRNDYRNMQAFWRGMNRFRLSDYGAVFRVAEAVPEGSHVLVTPPPSRTPAEPAAADPTASATETRRMARAVAPATGGGTSTSSLSLGGGTAGL